LKHLQKRITLLFMNPVAGLAEEENAEV